MKKAENKSAEKATDRMLTETELELMTILWRIGEGSVAEVLEKLPRERDLAYTSVSTILRILERTRRVHSLLQILPEQAL